MAENNEKLFGDKKIPMKVMLKRLMHYILPEWKAFTLAFLLIVINVAIDVALPLALRYTTPLLGRVRLFTAITSPSTTTFPLSSSRVLMGTVFPFMGLPYIIVA